MYRDLRVAVVIPCYNEELLIEQGPVKKLPEFLNNVICVNDGSKDATGSILKVLAKKNAKVIALDNDVNSGIGYTLIHGYKHALEKTEADVHRNRSRG